RLSRHGGPSPERRRRVYIGRHIVASFAFFACLALGHELVGESHDRFLLARGSDALAEFELCSQPLQWVAILLASFAWWAAAAPFRYGAPPRIGAILFGTLLQALGAHSIGADRKNGLVVSESIGAWRIREITFMDGEQPLCEWTRFWTF